jgi:hypothetical protein
MPTRLRLFFSLAVLSVFCHSTVFGFTPDELWRIWPEERFVTTSAPCLRPAELLESVTALERRHPVALQVAEIGRSFQDRPIMMMTLGRGPVKIMLWSQMHGDEPSATPALLDIAEYLLSRAKEPEVAQILDDVTLLMIPMLNPDGSESYSRRNAQGIDINRDALNLATPEGRLLKRIRDEHDPILGFNLHDQNRRTAVGDTGVLATNAVLAVSGDPEGTLTPERLRAKRACAAIIKALAPFMPGGMARYDEDWSPRAFGDNLTAWGTAVVLIESGGLPPGREMSELTRLNFVAILTVLRDFVRNDLADYDPELYELLPRNESDSWSDIAVRGGYVLQPGTTTPYRSDLSINLAEDDRHAAGCVTGFSGRSRIMEVGDSRFIAAGKNVDATGSLIVAPFEVAVQGWRARRWLDEGELKRLAGMGISGVRWEVKSRHLDRARVRAAMLNALPGVRLEVTDESTPATWVVLKKPPAGSGSGLLKDQLLALAGRKMKRTLEAGPPEVALKHLWPRADEVAEAGAVIRPQQPASFLLVSPAPEGRIDLEMARLTAIWIDGREIEAKPE